MIPEDGELPEPQAHLRGFVLGQWVTDNGLDVLFNLPRRFDSRFAWARVLRRDNISDQGFLAFRNKARNEPFDLHAIG